MLLVGVVAVAGAVAFSSRMLCERVGVATSIGSKTLSGGKGCATKSIVLLVGVVAVVFPERMLSRLNGSTSKASSSVAKSAAAALTSEVVSKTMYVSIFIDMVLQWVLHGLKGCAIQK